MPRPGPRRPLIALRFDPDVLARVDQLAETEGLTRDGGDPNRSEAVRLLVAYALAEMPAGWRPAT